MKLYGADGRTHEVEEVRERNYIELWLDNKFYCTCEDREEVLEEIADMKICFGLSECPA